MFPVKSQFENVYAQLDGPSMLNTPPDNDVVSKEDTLMFSSVNELRTTRYEVKSDADNVRKRMESLFPTTDALFDADGLEIDSDK